MNDDHTPYEESIGAYLLGALSELEIRAFERHLESCAVCREEIERLRPAAEALPRSVQPVVPPPSLKASLMEAVEEDVRERGDAPARLAGVRERLGRLMPDMSRMRPAVAWVSASFLLVAGIATGYGITQLGSDGGTRTVAAKVDPTRIPFGSASLVLPEDRGDVAVLRVHGMPTLTSGRVYQVWLKREGEVVSQSLFSVAEDGNGAGALKDDVEKGDAVLVTREPAGGARAPSEPPVLSAKL